MRWVKKLFNAYDVINITFIALVNFILDFRAVLQVTRYFEFEEKKKKKFILVLLFCKSFNFRAVWICFCINSFRSSK